MLQDVPMTPGLGNRAAKGRAAVHSTPRYEAKTNTLTLMLVDLMALAAVDGEDFDLAMAKARQLAHEQYGFSP